MASRFGPWLIVAVFIAPSFAGRALANGTEGPLAAPPSDAVTPAAAEMDDARNVVITLPQLEAPCTADLHSVFLDRTFAENGSSLQSLASQRSAESLTIGVPEVALLGRAGRSPY